MNWIDIVLIIIVLLSVWSGWQKGFILGALNLITWVGSLLAGFFFYPYVGAFLQGHLPALGVWTLPVAFILIVIAGRILLSVIANQILGFTPDATHYNDVNRFLGIIPGFINGVIYATFVAALLLALPISDALSVNTRDSKIADKLAAKVEWLNEKVSPIFNPAVHKTLNKVTIEPKSNEIVKLPFKVTNPKVREDLEARMLDLVNEERTKRGLHPLKADPELTVVARAHSRDMFARGYFAHYTPEGKDPFDRMRAAHVHFLTAGENLALAQTLSIAHQGLMNSPGHRANILQPDFGRVGIGILDGGIYGLMISQEFRN